MTYPSISAYNAAVRSIGSTGQTATLRSLTARTQGWNLPRVISGGFALTYELTGTGSGRYALRCFQEEQGDRPRRYKAMARYLGSLSPEDRARFVSFEYLPEGLEAGGSLVPVVLMEWAPGTELGLYLEQYHGDAAHLGNLRDGISDLAAFLETQEFAHGDLQVGNLFVRDSGDLVMIDYDGAWLPDLADLGEHEHGHINFQHPLREEYGADSTMDRFSLIAIDVALQALIARPALWEMYASGENVLFGQGDFVDPANSALFGDLAGLPAVAVAAEIFAATCTGAYDEIPTLSAFRNAAAAAKPGQARPAPAPATPAPQRTPTQSRAATGAAASPGRSASVQPPAPRVYRGQYPVLEATRVSSIANHEGRKVEVVGRVYDIKEGETKYGDPYIFVNFSDWRGRAFKINVWSDGLDEFEEWPDTSWVGRWLSVTGLVDEPYTNERLNYTHHSITANNPTQIRLISAEEAAFRLGDQVSSGDGSSTSGGARLGTARGGSGRPSSGQSRSSRNADLAATLGPSRRQRGADPRPSASRTGPAATPSSASRGQPAAQRSAPPTTTPSRPGCSGVFWIIAIVVAIIIAAGTL